jgi:hypothetical protein
MSFSLKSLALSSLAVLAISLPAFAQTATIEGIVKDESGKPIQNAVVNIGKTGPLRPLRSAGPRHV